MALVKCPDCGKMISEYAPACIGCGRPKVLPVGSALPSPAEPSQGSTFANPRQTGMAADRMPLNEPVTPKEMPSKKRWRHWTPFLVSLVSAVLINIVLSAIAEQEPKKNIVWTAIWIYLTIKAWDFWKWKGLLPYPIMLLTSVLFSHMSSELSISWAFVNIVINIGGIVIFFLFLRQNDKNMSVNKGKLSQLIENGRHNFSDEPSLTIMQETSKQNAPPQRQKERSNQPTAKEQTTKSAQAQQLQEPFSKTQDQKLLVLDKIFTRMSGFFQWFILVLLPDITLVLGIFGMIGCKEPMAKKRAGKITLISLIWSIIIHGLIFL